MNNEIKPHYVDFNTAKWLKEKEFDVNVKSYYTTSEEFTPKDYYYFGNEINYNSPVNDVNTINGTISRPEQWQVVEWLLVNHGIWIHSAPENNEEDVVKWAFTIQRIDSEVRFVRRVGEFNSPQEAYSAAFDDISNNLL
jgi:hypothetical protein